MPAKIKIIETFSSVLKDKKNFSAVIRKFYEFYLIKKARYSKTVEIDSRKLILGAKMLHFRDLHSLNYSPFLADSFFVSFLNDIDQGKNFRNTAYFKIMRKYGGADFAKKRVKNFKSLYQVIKNTKNLSPILVYDSVDWKTYPDYPKKITINKPQRGFIIFDGHHRVAVMVHLGTKKIPAKIVKKESLWRLFE